MKNLGALFGALERLPRRGKRLVMLGADLVMLPLALWASVALRLGQPFPELAGVWWVFVLLPALSVPIFNALGLYRAVVRYMGPQAVFAVLKGVSLSALILAAVVLLKGYPQVVPRSSLILYWLIALVGVAGTRFIARAYFQAVARMGQSRERVVIYGAGAAGAQLAETLANGPLYEPVAFVDDDGGLYKSVVNGIKVYKPKALADLIPRLEVTQVLLAIPSMTRARRREIISRLESLHIPVKTVPPVADLIAGKGRLEEVREVQIEDLLGRDPVQPNQQLLDACVRGKAVLVTGAGGSIGSELCRQIIRLRPTKLVLVDSAEYNLYRIERELALVVAREGLDVELAPLLGSVTDRPRMLRIMQSFHVQTVYHAAAYKHVPLVEFNLLEGARNNTLGTSRTAQAAIDAGVETFVLISTDKAVRPTNVMGATKRLAELVLQGLAQQEGATRFCMVRFGNVLGSSGSVVPLFREQIRAGGTVTVTHPDITRYFMTIPEAAELVIQAGSLGKGGDVFVLDMGEPVRIVDLARKMIHLMGYEVRDENCPDGEVAIEFTGLRPGEKLFEELLIGDNVTGTAHPMIMRAEEASLPWERMRLLLAELETACRAFDCHGALRVLQEAVDGYSTAGELQDLLWRQHPGGQPVAGTNNITWLR